MDQRLEELLATFPVTAKTDAFLRAPKKFYIGGKHTQGRASNTLAIEDPSTATTLATVPEATPGDIDDAVAAARTALEGPWGALKANERQRVLLKLADLVERDAQTLAEIESLDTGKAIGPCIDVDILGSADLIRYMAGWATKIDGATRSVSAPGGHFAYTLKEPIGVVGAIVPWNWPFNMATWKYAAALAAGCTVIIKPAEMTPLSMLYFAQLCDEAGLPAGVMNIVPGTGAEVGDYLVRHAGVDKVSFTGSTTVGRSVGAAAASHLAPTTLELGGKSPMIVFEDADIAAVAEATRWSVYFNSGQVCSAGSRLYAHKRIHSEVIAAIRDKAMAIKLAPGLDPECDMGPVISAKQKDRVMNYIDIGIREGAAIVCGGHAPEGAGHFVEPTLMTISDNKARIVQEEIFGPVLVVLPFEDEAEVLEKANDSPYGLAGSIWTKDLSRAHRLIPKLKAGSIWVNTHDLGDSAIPFGGYKQSGYGKDLGPEQLSHYLKTKAAWIKYE